jgi:alpha-1,2-mannosyltransferase
MIAWTAFATVGLVALAIALLGPGPWQDYVGDTLPTLSALEREGSGPFMSMIPSTFMSMRIVTDNSTFALLAHAIFAAAVTAILVFRLYVVQNAERRAAMLLLATVLVTPYMHNYDLALLLCGALLVARRWATNKRFLPVELLVMVAWALPHLVVILNGLGAPISSFLILPLLFLA